tara:strand:- start:245 stop:391 length:147 start_codon:yes stop_codon:yes gene_type:complete
VENHGEINIDNIREKKNIFSPLLLNSLLTKTEISNERRRYMNQKNNII